MIEHRISTNWMTAEKVVGDPGNLLELCITANRAVKSGSYDGVNFRLFNGRELLEVRKIMQERYPDIHYSWSVITLHDILPSPN